jgi:hypothetical protein
LTSKDEFLNNKIISKLLMNFLKLKILNQNIQNLEAASVFHVRQEREKLLKTAKIRAILLTLEASCLVGHELECGLLHSTLHGGGRR